MDEAATARLPDIDPLLSLAHTVHATPSSHALLFGSGVSITAGVPSAWGVQETLITQLATQQGDDSSKGPACWFRDKYGSEPRYVTLLEALAPTPVERQKLLRQFFEPDDQEREQGLKRPTAAHHATARLVANGSLRVILTLNFDRLMETALREAGIEPTVVASISDLAGLPPIHTLPALVVHLHGDYLTPVTMLNTQAELERYDPVVDAFLDRLFADYGLIAVGWSATYDPALRAAIARTPSRIFTPYWIEPGHLSETANDLRVLRGMVRVTATADQAMVRLAAAVEALADRNARHPLALPVAVATAKRELAGRTTAVGLHDAIRDEFTRVRNLPDLTRTDYQRLPEGDTYETALARVEEGLSVADGLIATTAYWGRRETDNWWIPEIERFAQPRRNGGLTALLRLANLPAVHFLHAAGVASVAAGRYELTHRLLAGPRIRNHHGQGESVASYFPPGAVMETVTAPSHHLFAALAPTFVDHLALGQRVYEDSWERFEFLRMVEVTFEHARAPELIRRIAMAEQTRAKAAAAVEERITGGDPDEIGEARVALTTAWQDHDRARGAYADQVWVQAPHLRVADSALDACAENHGHVPVVGLALLAEFDHLQEAHPLVEAGFCRGDLESLTTTCDAVNVALGRRGRDAAFRMMGGRSGVVPDYFWFDTQERPAT